MKCSSKEILALIRDHIKQHDRPPTVRELTRLAGYRSPRSIQRHLDSLEEAGEIHREQGKSRGLSLVNPPTAIPVVGLVAAGHPILAEEHIDEHLDLSSWLSPPAPSPDEPVFAVRVCGESMRDCGIMDGDHVIVCGRKNIRSGEIAVVYIDGEATVKRVELKGRTLILHPENPDFSPTVIPPNTDRDVQIGGAVIGVVRRYS